MLSALLDEHDFLVHELLQTAIFCHFFTCWSGNKHDSYVELQQLSRRYVLLPPFEKYLMTFISWSLLAQHWRGFLPHWLVVHITGFQILVSFALMTQLRCLTTSMWYDSDQQHAKINARITSYQISQQSERALWKWYLC